MALNIVEAILLSLSEPGPCELAAAADDMCHGLCMLLTQPAFGVLHSVVDLVCYCPGVEGLLLSSHDRNLGVRSDVAFIDICLQLLTHHCARHHAEAYHTRLQLHPALSRWLLST